MKEVFLDAAYVIALSSPKDQYHYRAKLIAERLEVESTRIITTRAVILEIGNALSKQKYRRAAVELLDSLEEDPNVMIIPLTENLYRRSFKMFRERGDKEWGITDCISFVVMKDRNLADALTTDDHFKQAGFRTLLTQK